MKKIIITPSGIEEVELTAEEIAQAETNDASSQLKLQQEEAEKITKENNKTSATNKLKALGLTDAEIGALKI
tara:strand:- start:221 stop:436 length:216 start_codon:yes stop_codon:yes gene_type:complete